MSAMSRSSGVNISLAEHLRQSIVDIIMTPIGSRVAVRDYGSYFYTLVDRPVSRQWVQDGFMSIAAALQRWEPRYILNRIEIDLTNLAEYNIVSLTLRGVEKITGRVLVLENINLDLGNFSVAPAV